MTDTIPAPPRTVYRPLSSLIREGAKLRPQAFGATHLSGKAVARNRRKAVRLEDYARAKQVGATCALGAALEAAGYGAGLTANAALSAGILPPYAGWVTIANDRLHKTRESIADELERSGMDPLIALAPGTPVPLPATAAK